METSYENAQAGSLSESAKSSSRSAVIGLVRVFVVWSTIPFISVLARTVWGILANPHIAPMSWAVMFPMVRALFFLFVLGSFYVAVGQKVARGYYVSVAFLFVTLIVQALQLIAYYPKQPEIGPGLLQAKSHSELLGAQLAHDYFAPLFLAAHAALLGLFVWSKKVKRTFGLDANIN